MNYSKKIIKDFEIRKIVTELDPDYDKCLGCDNNVPKEQLKEIGYEGICWKCRNLWDRDKVAEEVYGLSRPC